MFRWTSLTLKKNSSSNAHSIRRTAMLSSERILSISSRNSYIGTSSCTTIRRTVTASLSTGIDRPRWLHTELEQTMVNPFPNIIDVWFSTLCIFLHSGLRVMLYANVSEYLPTSESVGFRITVHDKWIVPFPDAFGYNAPTGFLSSFGVRMVPCSLLYDGCKKTCVHFRSSSFVSKHHMVTASLEERNQARSCTMDSTTPWR